MAWQMSYKGYSSAKNTEARFDPQVQNAMMDKRWIYFRFTRSFDGADRQEVQPCAKCFARWVMEEETISVDFF